MTQEYRPVIETIIKRNSRYSGNEDLFEDFCSETLKRSYKILEIEGTIENIEAYLSKVVTSSILHVLKSYGRLRRVQTSYKQVKTSSLSQVYNTDKNFELIYDIQDPVPDIEESLIHKEEAEKIARAIQSINNDNANKQYLKIYKLKYIEGKTQTEIAKELKISQGEVSKRLIQLGTKVLKQIHS